MKECAKEVVFMVFTAVVIIGWFVFVSLVIDARHSKIAARDYQKVMLTADIKGNNATVKATEQQIESECQTEPTTESSRRNVTTEEYNLLLRVCMSECGGRYGEPLEGKVAVVETILNRVDMGYGTIKEVVFAKDQYSTANNGEPDYTVVEAVEMALQGDMYPNDMIYFRTKHFHTFGTPYMQIGSHFFSLEGNNE